MLKGDVKEKFSEINKYFCWFECLQRRYNQKWCCRSPSPLLPQDVPAGWPTCVGWLCAGPWGRHAWGSSPPSPCLRPSRASCCTWTEHRPPPPPLLLSLLQLLLLLATPCVIELCDFLCLWFVDKFPNAHSSTSTRLLFLLFITSTSCV